MLLYEDLGPQPLKIQGGHPLRLTKVPRGGVELIVLANCIAEPLAVLKQRIIAYIVTENFKKHRTCIAVQYI